MSSENNIDSAKEGYEGFTSLIKWGTIGSFLVAAFVVVLISS
jgi:hypothetical protein